jgi:hypothetical protein
VLVLAHTCQSAYLCVCAYNQSSKRMVVSKVKILWLVYDLCVVGMSDDWLSHGIPPSCNYMLIVPFICCCHVGTAGSLEEVDHQRVVLSLIEKYHQLLIQGQALPLQLISSFLNAYPECSLFFQQSR